MIDIAFLPEELTGRDLANTACVVLDVFRATTSIVAAMNNACPAIYPVLSVEKAWEVAGTMPGALLAGERGSIKIEGFDLGNSPREFSRDRLAGRPVVMTTTNGTKAIRAAGSAANVLIGSFLNVSAVCRKLQTAGRDVLFVCAGTENRFSLEDALCAGMMAHRMQTLLGENVKLTDAAQSGILLFLQAQKDLPAVAVRSRNGQRLCELELMADVEFCFQIDSVDTVPSYQEGFIRLFN